MSVPAAAAVAAPLIEAKNLSRHYNLSSGLWGRGETVRAVDGVSFSLTAGRTLAIVGESGCGKSTLARMIALIEPPTGGSLKFSGREASSAKGPDLKGFRCLVQMVFQDPYGTLNPRHKVGTILMEPLSINTALTRDEREQAARAMMGRVGLRQEHFIRYPHMFPAGSASASPSPAR